MKFSISFFSKTNGEYQKEYRDIFEIIRIAEKDNYYGLWLPERHFHKFGGLFPSPSVLASAITASTTNIKVFAGSVILPLHDPIHVAEEWALIDQLSKGRVGVSFAPGWNINDFINNPNNFNIRKDLMWKGISDIQELWENKSEISIFPQPYNNQLPIYITSATSIETCYLAGKKGYNLLTHFIENSMESLQERINCYKQGLKDGNHEIDKKDIVLMMHTFIGENEQEIKSIVMDPFYEYQSSFLNLAGQNINNNPREKQVAKILMLNKYSPKYSLIGTMDSCIELLKQLDYIGVTHISALIDFGIEKQNVIKSLSRLTEIKQKFE